MEYIHVIKKSKLRPDYTKSFANEIGRLNQGVRVRAEGTDTIFFLYHHNIPKNRQKYVTYGSIFVDYRPQDYYPYHTCHGVGGNIIKYLGEVNTQTSGLIKSKLLVNGNISTPEARFICCNIKKNLGNPI